MPDMNPDSAPQSADKRRPIRSFVLRQGRLTPAQERAFERLWPRWGLDWQAGDAPLDLPGLFGNDRDVLVEIGFGNGESLAEMAERHPERNHLGIEVHGPGVGHLLLEIERRELTNLRLLRTDAMEVLRGGLAADSIATLLLYFPDPWPKTKHHKRRILNPGFLDALARVLRPGGLFHAATDWEHYAEQMLSILEADDRFSNQAGRGQFSPRPGERPSTRFERRGERLGHRVRDLMFRRRP